MCIIVHRPPDVNISYDKLENCWDNNDDGAGLMWARNKRICVQKGIMEFKNFIKHYEAAPKNVDIFLHFRIRTHGLASKEMTHPHKINKGIWMMHNGVINNLGNDIESDSHHFAQMLKPLSAYDLIQDSFSELIGKLIGSYNKIVILNNSGKFSIINKGEWKEHEGCLYSNMGYTKRTISYPTRYAGYAGAEDWDYYYKEEKKFLDKTKKKEAEDTKQVTATRFGEILKGHYCPQCLGCIVEYLHDKPSEETEELYCCRDCDKYFFDNELLTEEGLIGL